MVARTEDTFISASLSANRLAGSLAAKNAPEESVMKFTVLIQPSGSYQGELGMTNVTRNGGGVSVIHRALLSWDPPVFDHGLYLYIARITLVVAGILAFAAGIYWIVALLR